MASDSKRRRANEENVSAAGQYQSDTVSIKCESDFVDFSEDNLKILATSLYDLSSMRHKIELTPLKFIDSNAASHDGQPFSKAYCTAEEHNSTYLLGDIFRRGLQILFDFCTEKKIPDSCSHQEKFILRKILHFIEQVDNFPVDSVDCMSRTDLMQVFSNHLFGPLSTSPQFNIDQRYAGEGVCLCDKPDCRLTGVFGDTSIGNLKVWHGNLDLVVNDDLPVTTIENTPDDEASSDLSKNAQVIARTIVFSFYQMQKQPERDHFLFPCVGIENSEVILMVYDSEHDVLLESAKIPLFSYDDGDEKLNPLVITIVWLVVNHRYLCSGLTAEMKEQKANFFVNANDKLQVYRNELRIGNVFNSCNLTKKTHHKNKRTTCSSFLSELHKNVHDFLK